MDRDTLSLFAIPLHFSLALLSKRAGHRKPILLLL
jgi:hypothetical protein